MRKNQVERIQWICRRYRLAVPDRLHSGRDFHYALRWPLDDFATLSFDAALRHARKLYRASLIPDPLDELGGLPFDEAPGPVQRAGSLGWQDRAAQRYTPPPGPLIRSQSPED